MGVVQRRDLQPRRGAARARAARPRLPHANPTPRRSCTPTSSGATTASTASAACSRSRCGMRRSAGCCSSAIASASSRCTGREPAIRCCSRRRSRRCSRAGWSHRRPTKRRFPRRSAPGTSRAPDTMFRGVQKLLPGHLLVFEDGEVKIRQVPGMCRRAGLKGRASAEGGRRRAVPRAARGVGPPAADERRARSACSCRAASTAARSRR